MTNAVATIAPLKRALALADEAGDIPKLRDIAAMAAALQKGAQARGMGLNAENQAAEVVIRAERAMGRILAGVERAKTGPKTDGEGSIADGNLTPFRQAMEDAGITYLKQAAQWQALAAIPDDVFEAKFGAIKEAGNRLAKVDFYRLVKGGEKIAREARKDIAEAMHADDATPLLVQFRKVAEQVTNEMAQFPTDELPEVAGLIKGLADSYNAVRAARS